MSRSVTTSERRNAPLVEAVWSPRAMLPDDFVSAIGHPLRIRVLALLDAGAPLTTSELIDKIGDENLTISSLNYHMNLLLKADVVEVVATTRRRGFNAKMWQTRKPGWRSLERRLRTLVSERDGGPS